MSKAHVHTDGATPKYMLLPGDPGRVPVIGADWDQYAEISFNREFRLARGSIDGVELGACSTGIGAPSAEIALVELAAAGSGTFIRVGTCGALAAEIAPGRLVIHEGAVRLVGATDAYCERDYPAIADRLVTAALIEACEELEYAYDVGLTASTDSFYAGQENALPAGLESPATVAFTAKMRGYGVATFEMEAAHLFVLARLFKRRCGSICAVGSNRATGLRLDAAEAADGIGRACRAASRAVVILERRDASRRRA